MKRALIILSLAGLTGCAHFVSQPLAPAQTAVQLESQGLSDPGLRRFLEQNLGRTLPVWPLPEWNLTTLTLAAFYYQPSLAVARAQWGVSEAGVKTAGGRPNPTLTLLPGYDTTATVISHWLPLGSLDWPVETAGKRGKRIAGAQAQADSARWDIITTAWQVRANVRDTLLDWQIAERRSVLLEQECALQAQIVQRLEQRAAAGEVARPELVTAQIARRRMESDRLAAQAQSSDARARLAGALGLGTAALAGIKVAADLPADLPPALTAPEARRVALTTRSDIMGALADYAAAEDDWKLEIAKQYPDVHVNPGYQYNQGDNQWLLGVTLELPVLNQNQGPIAEAEARRKLAAAKFMALQAQVISQLDQAAANYQRAQEQLASGENLSQAEGEQAAATEAQLKAGAADQFDLLAAQLDQAGTTLSQLDNTAQLLRARGALEDALQQPLDALTPAVFQNLTQEPTLKKTSP
jgi:outer membrane protein TolC